MNSNSINNNRLNPHNIGILSNKAFKRNYSDNDDITVECDEVPIENQFKFWSELLNTKSISFSHSFMNNSVDNTQPISCNEVQECFNALHDGAPGIDNIKKK